MREFDRLGVRPKAAWLASQGRKAGQALYQDWLNTDVELSTQPCLARELTTTAPANATPAEERRSAFVDPQTLAADVVLQVVFLLNVGVSTHSQLAYLRLTRSKTKAEVQEGHRQLQNQDRSRTRMLKLKLTDGTDTICGFEQDLVKGLSIFSKPGTKLVVKRGTEFRGGFLHLTAANVHVLGGKVEALERAYTLERFLKSTIGEEDDEDEGDGVLELPGPQAEEEPFELSDDDELDQAMAEAPLPDAVPPAPAHQHVPPARSRHTRALAEEDDAMMEDSFDDRFLSSAMDAIEPARTHRAPPPAAAAPRASAPASSRMRAVPPARAKAGAPSPPAGQPRQPQPQPQPRTQPRTTARRPSSLANPYQTKGRSRQTDGGARDQPARPPTNVKKMAPSGHRQPTDGGRSAAPFSDLAALKRGTPRGAHGRLKAEVTKISGLGVDKATKSWTLNFSVRTTGGDSLPCTAMGKPIDVLLGMDCATFAAHKRRLHKREGTSKNHEWRARINNVLNTRAKALLGPQLLVVDPQPDGTTLVVDVPTVKPPDTSKSLEELIF